MRGRPAPCTPARAVRGRRSMHSARLRISGASLPAHTAPGAHHHVCALSAHYWRSEIAPHDGARHTGASSAVHLVAARLLPARRCAEHRPLRAHPPACAAGLVAPACTESRARSAAWRRARGSAPPEALEALFNADAGPVFLQFALARLAVCIANTVVSTWCIEN